MTRNVFLNILPTMCVCPFRYLAIPWSTATYFLLFVLTNDESQGNHLLEIVSMTMWLPRYRLLMPIM